MNRITDRSKNITLPKTSLGAIIEESGRDGRSGSATRRLRRLRLIPFRFNTHLQLLFECNRGVLVLPVRKRSYGKVMFLHLSVILFTGVIRGRGRAWQGGMRGGGGGRAWQERWLLLRTVRILLEYILVFLNFCKVIVSARYCGVCTSYFFHALT